MNSELYLRENSAKRVITQKRIVDYIRRNPGLTTVQLTRLLRGSNMNRYTPGSFNAKLIKLQKRGLIVRKQGNSAVSDTAKAWRHYPVTKLSKFDEGRRDHPITCPSYANQTHLYDR